MIKSDFHTHTTLSSDGISAMPQMVEQAIACAIDTYCITEHYDYDNNNKKVAGFLAEFPEYAQPESPVPFICDMKAYHSEFSKMRDQYSSDIDLRFGIELGLMPHLGDYYRAFASQYPFDFIIGSTHEAGGIDPFYPDYLVSRTPAEGYRLYLETEYENLKACLGAYDVCGHIDYAMRYHTSDDSRFKYSDYADILDKILEFLISNGLGIECNTGGFSYFCNEPNPRTEIIKRYRQLGGEIITVGSDAHKTDNIARHFDKAEAILKECGFKYYTVFKNRTPEFIKL